MKLLCNKYFLLFSFGVFCLFSCRQSLFSGVQHCKNYNFDADKKTFVNSANQPVVCTLADNVRIFEYMPGEGCAYWRQSFQVNETVKFAEMAIQLGSGDNGVARKYCVLQRYIEHDNSGQVLLVGDQKGVFCFTSPKNDQTYTYSLCNNVYRRKPGQSSRSSTPSKKDTDTEEEEEEEEEE